MSLDSLDLDRLARNISYLDAPQKERVLDLLEERDRFRRLEEARTRFIPFVKMMWPDVVLGAHHTIMAEAFEKLITGEWNRLIINIAPRHSKSEFTSWLLPAWFMGRFPKSKIMQCMNTQDLAAGFGRRVRNTISREAIATELKGHDPYHDIFPDMDLAKDSGAASHWHDITGSEYYGVGTGGKIAGRGADCAYFSCRCLTKRGYLPIADVRVGDQVWAYDHGKQTETWTTVRAISTQRKPRIVDCGGFLCTPEHRVYTGRGYRRALEARHDPSVVRSMREEFRAQREGVQEVLPNLWEGERDDVLFGRLPAKPGNIQVPSMRRSEGLDGGDLQSLLPEGQTRPPHMQELREGRQAYEVRAEQERQNLRRHGQRVLRSRLLPRLQDGASAREDDTGRCVLDVRETRARQQEVLLHGVLSGYAAEAGSGRAPVYGQVEPGTTPDQETIQRRLRDVRSGQGSRAGAPRRPRRDQPFEEQPRSTLRTVSRPVSSDVHGHCARDFEGVLSGAGHWVVDIQTDTQNFFCEGVLAHNCLIIDDPHSEQEAKMAESNPEVFDDVYNWYVYGPRQRLQPGGRICVVQTRWSKRDLTGRLIQKMAEDDSAVADRWHVIELPAILDEGTGTERSLWPQYWPLKTLQATRAALPVSAWQAQYQQQPTSQSAAIFKKANWRRWGSDKEQCPGPRHLRAWENLEPPACDYIIASWDAAATKNDRSHPSAYTLWGVFKVEDPVTGKEINNVILLSSFTARMEFPELKKKAKLFYDEDRPDTLLIENKSAGMQLIQEFRSMGIPAESFTGSSRGTKKMPNDKIARANMVADIFASRYVWAPERRFADVVIEQMSDFPGGVEDDLVDSAVQAMLRFRDGGFISTANDQQDDEEDTAPRRRRRYY